ncbi:Carbon storage regulator [Polystyrenella longa]|uniref:Translational regulator CsrA n=1 Tax=Polystyrenella longa TaxID=2528007 RepID=A0A518CQ10_9PLAN|nr:carbon storage regulator [Polystyrenella longa]QDU81321.1 Carbon storage regulator [Polystyrenella longa]
MLVLSRKPGESIVIADNVHISIIKVHGNRIQIGIQAPDDVVIRRAELEVAPKRNLSDSHTDFEMMPS